MPIMVSVSPELRKFLPQIDVHTPKLGRLDVEERPSTNASEEKRIEYQYAVAITDLTVDEDSVYGTCQFTVAKKKGDGVLVSVVALYVFLADIPTEVASLGETVAKELASSICANQAWTRFTSLFDFVNVDGAFQFPKLPGVPGSVLFELDEEDEAETSVGTGVRHTAET